MYLDFATAAWSWPQWTVFIMHVLPVVLVAFIHGHPRTGTWSFPVQLISSAIGLFLLTAGGFFGAA